MLITIQLLQCLWQEHNAHIFEIYGHLSTVNCTVAI